MIVKPRPLKGHQVAQSLRQLIQTMASGERLPTVTDLEQQFGVAAGTIRAALGTLQREGLVVSRQGSGTYVAPTPRSGSVIGPDVLPATMRTLAVFSRYASPYYQGVLEHLTREAARVPLAVECRYADPDLTLEDVLRFEALHPVGFIAVTTDLAWVAKALIERKHAAIVLGEPPVDAEPDVPIVCADAERGGFLATRHLLDLGHRRIAYVHRFGSDDELQQRWRWHGHVRALRNAGVHAEPPVTVNRVQFDRWMENPETLGDFLDQADAPTALAVWSDQEAVQVIGALRRAGKRVPDDVSLIGYDNLPVGEHCFPALDTVDQHHELQIRHALSLLSLPAAQQVVAKTLVTPTLHRRESCAPPRR